MTTARQVIMWSKIVFAIIIVILMNGHDNGVHSVITITLSNNSGKGEKHLYITII